MNKKKNNSSPGNKIKAYCQYCGSTVGEISDRTEELITSIYECKKCDENYCDQCSYEKNIDKHVKQFCLRCESEIEKIM